MELLLVGLALAWFVWWFFLTPGPPAREKSKPLTRVSELAPRLSMMTVGSRLTVTEVSSGLSFSLRKLEDEGGAEQTVAFCLEEEGWPEHRVSSAVEQLKQIPEVRERDVVGSAPGRFVVGTVVAQPRAMPVLVGGLLHRLQGALGFDEGARFHLVLEGAMDMAIWRRLNIEHLRGMAADDQPWLHRVYGRRQVRKHKDESEST